MRQATRHRQETPSDPHLPQNPRCALIRLPSAQNGFSLRKAHKDLHVLQSIFGIARRLTSAGGRTGLTAHRLRRARNLHFRSIEMKTKRSSRRLSCKAFRARDHGRGAKLFLISTLFAAAALAAAPALAHNSDDDNGPVANTTEGPVRGLTKDKVSQFLGIPYAAPPVGDLRWRPPQPPRKHGLLDATQYASPCPQVTSLGVFAGPASINEDCLYLNVFTTEAGTSRSWSGFTVAAISTVQAMTMTAPSLPRALAAPQWWSPSTIAWACLAFFRNRI